ncbi:YciI-like protein [Sphingomonas sp. HF-S4]|uniref:YciI-like protein n=1 Tax=Sphingomonas agrestis TaxID=3080540 RepID=A0ABU3Y970_9SPHN|nr:YciI-like protein [Sphingomonas sp. HF-S4]MDV3457941.1 YciI-like protein [Sphingomonas sp. HF-S4]
MKHYIVFLEFSDNFEGRRAAFRNDHLTKAWAAVDRGELVLAGALANPVDEGIFLFAGDGPDAAQKFVDEDPYINNGLVRSWRIREWATTVGKEASNIVRPD